MKFRFFDKVITCELEGSGSMVTQKVFPRVEDYLAGPFHPPGKVPASLLLETMAVSGGHLIHAVTQERLLPMMVRVEEASFAGEVFGGDEVRVRSEMLAIQDRSGEALGLARTRSEASVAGRTVAGARIVYLCIPANGYK